MPNWPWRRRRAVRAAAGQSEEEPTIEDRIRALERWQKDQVLTMEEWHGKMRRVLARINRSHEREEEGSLSDGDKIGGQRPDPSQLTVFEAKRRLGVGAP